MSTGNCSIFKTSSLVQLLFISLIQNGILCRHSDLQAQRQSRPFLIIPAFLKKASFPTASDCSFVCPLCSFILILHPSGYLATPEKTYQLAEQLWIHSPKSKDPRGPAAQTDEVFVPPSLKWGHISLYTSPSTTTLQNRSDRKGKHSHPG